MFNTLFTRIVHCSLISLHIKLWLLSICALYTCSERVPAWMVFFYLSLIALVQTRTKECWCLFMEGGVVWAVLRSLPPPSAKWSARVCGGCWYGTWPLAGVCCFLSCWFVFQDWTCCNWCQSPFPRVFCWFTASCNINFKVKYRDTLYLPDSWYYLMLYLLICLISSIIFLLRPSLDFYLSGILDHFLILL